ncbi:hypothetical protein K458DRAFT_418441 [Lentithecium fluviatile CBS 122367]|uniref:Secreted protein n=1 Tax=Lentithecium fluviatile CBS 122367 TaxID=1168545 RepID=A0A6G1J1V2_9PLEO|nr:hypothetical protein K458DRAFT_418441 [Lentithecium fluviatile CBS 122367]
MGVCPFLAFACLVFLLWVLGVLVREKDCEGALGGCVKCLEVERPRACLVRFAMSPFVLRFMARVLALTTSMEMLAKQDNNKCAGAAMLAAAFSCEGIGSCHF